MRRTRFCVALFVVCCSGVVARAGLNGSVFLMPINESFASHGEADYVDALRNVDPSAVLSGTHSVHGAQVFETPVQGSGQYSYVLEGPAQPGACYGTTLHVVGDPPGVLNGDEKTWNGTTQCAPPPQTGGGGPCGDGGCERSESCPLILDLNADGIHTTGLDDPVHFWIDLEGRSEATAWTDPGTEEAFLWTDLNHDHTAQVTELFGSRMVAPNGGYYANGFEALLKFDRSWYGGNGDGQITHRDSVWPRLRLWVDRNHDAISQPTEISVLSSHRIVALNLAHIEGNTYDEHGNELYLMSSYVVRLRGQDTELRMMADVEFRYIPN